MDIRYFEDLRIINERLQFTHGRHTIKNLANFRLVFADDQVEKRGGEKSVYAGDIFLRTETGIHEVKKYPYLDDGCWVVERLIPNHHSDVFEGDYIYEPVYSFKIFPVWRAIEFLMYHLFNPQAHPKSDAEAKYIDEQKIIKEKAEIKNLLGSTDTEATISKLDDGSAISFAGGNYKPSEQENKN